MRIGSLSDGIATGIAWAPFLLVIAAFALYLSGGLAQFEAMTGGTHYMVPSGAAANPYSTLREQKAATQQLDNG